MDKRQAEVEKLLLEYEKQCLNDLQKTYTEALGDVKSKLRALLGREPSPSVAYQVEFQKTLQSQIENALDMLKRGNITSVTDFLNKTYEDGYLGTVYSIQGQGIPLNIGIDHKQIARTVNRRTDTMQFSQRLYDNVEQLGTAFKSQMARGIANNSGYSKIAKQLALESEASYKQAMRIVRTEGGRVKSEAKLDSMKKAKDEGADIVKQWDATFDNKTRAEHRFLDGQIREIGEPFEDSQGRKAQAPHKFGIASMDVNCRCIVVERARWALEGEEMPTKMDNTTGEIVEAKNYREWKEKYKRKQGAQVYNPETFLEEYKGVIRRRFSEDLTPRQQFEEYQKLYSKYQVGTANKDNFFYNSIAEFEEIPRRPRRKPDHVSYTRDGKVSSEYWYEGDTLIRGSDHWGNGVASCDWAIKGHGIGDNITHTSKIYGKVKFEDIKFKTQVITIDGQKHVVGFDNVIEFKTGRLTRKVYKVNGQVYINEGQYTFGEYVKANNHKGLYMADEAELGRLIKKQQAELKAAEEAAKAAEEAALKAQKELDEKHAELLRRGNVFDQNSQSAPKIGDFYLTRKNELLEIVEIGDLYGAPTVKVKDGREFTLFKAKANNND